jgi:hypothetical protein
MSLNVDSIEILFERHVFGSRLECLPFNGIVNSKLPTLLSGNLV